MWKVPLFDTAFDEKELEAVQRVIRSGWLTMGEVSREFEKRFAEFLDVKHAIAVSSCTAALHMANLAVGVGLADEVICPSLTFVATANSIVYTGARPVFADIESLDDFSISSQDIEVKITQRTKAIQVVHYAGYPCNMDRIMDIAKRYRLHVIEDCAHAPGAEYNGRKCGTIGDIGCFSFFSNKNMTTGEGGMIVTNRDDIAEKLRLIRSHGMTTLTWERHRGHAYTYDVVDLGFNFRIDEIRSALGLVQLSKLERNNERRGKLVNLYRKRLTDVEKIRIPFENYQQGKPSYHIFPVLLHERVSRRVFMDEMKQTGIQTSIHYPPIHLFTYYRNRFGYCEGMLPITENVSKREVTLPLHPLLKEESVSYIFEAIRVALQKSIGIVE